MYTEVKIIFSYFKNLGAIKNISWNFTGGIWLALLIVIATPWYVSKLGIELYGLLGIWLVFQAMMSLFDFGLGATIIKEFSSTKINIEEDNYKRDILRTIETFYWIIAGIIFVLLIIFSNFFLKDWFNFDSVENINLINIMMLMSLTLFLQFPNVLYLNGLIGLQNHKLMNILQIIGNSLKYGFGSLILIWHADLIWFFSVQIIVAAIQTFLTRHVLWKQISNNKISKPVFNLEIIRKSARFSFGMALTSISAVIIANIDRIAISNMLPAADLGRYAIAFTATGLLQLGIQPFYRSFFPRYSELFSKGENSELKNEYFLSNKMIATIIISLGTLCFFFAEDIFFVWMGNKDQTVIITFKFLIIGVMCSGLGWLPAAFQQAQGWTSLHYKMMIGSILIGTPLMIIAIKTFGVVGGATVWLIHGVSDITIGLWLMHKRLLKGELLNWYLSVLLPPILLSLPITYVSLVLKPNNLNRYEISLWVGITGIILLISSIIFLLKTYNKFKS